MEFRQGAGTGMTARVSRFGNERKQSSMANLIITGVVVVLMAVAVWFLSQPKQVNKQAAPAAQQPHG